MNDLVSIIMPVYNGEKYIAKSINSVIKQSYLNWELIIVNDNSNDRTQSIIREFVLTDDRIYSHNLIKNQGVANARNIGIKKSKGRFIAFLDSDDLWHEDKLYYQISKMSQEKHKFSFTAYEVINSDDRFIKTIKVPTKISYSKLKFYNPIGCLTVIIEKDLIKKTLFPKIKHEDYVFWLEILKNNKISAYGYSDTLAQYRKYSGSLSAKKHKTLLWTFAIHKKYFKSGLFISMFYTFSHGLYAFKKHYLGGRRK